MKKHCIIFALITLGSLFANQINAQKTTTWKGGTPGRETDWNCAKNWSDNAVPNAFSNVVIPDVSNGHFAPELSTGCAQINALTLFHNARLTIAPQAKLTICDRIECANQDQVKGRFELQAPPQKLDAGYAIKRHPKSTGL